MKNTSVITRRNMNVVGLHCEINQALYRRIEEYVELYEMTKRDIVAEALLLWLNGQDKERMR